MSPHPSLTPRRRLGPALLVAGLAVVALPASALAGTASLTPPGSNVPGGVTYNGDTLRNVVHIGAPSSSYSVTDDITTVTATAPCLRVAAGQAFCPKTSGGQPVTSYTVRLGDGNDTFFNDDTLVGLTNGYAEGGPGDDSLNTGRAPTNDRLFGQDGNDFIASGGGSDILRGGAGDDTINAVDVAEARGGDRIFCDAGFDRVTADLLDTIPFAADCEVVQTAAIDQFPITGLGTAPVRVRNGAVPLRVTCPRKATAVCAGTLTLRRGASGAGRRLGSAPYRVRRGASATVLVPVPAQLSGRIRAQAAARETDPHGMPKLTTVQLTLVG
jgi:Ca2+-binding RTX toxin-like protein